MNNTETITYLDRLLNLYSEKSKQFHLSLTLLVIIISAIFFFIFFPYITLLGNQYDCEIRKQENSQHCTNLRKSKLDVRASEVSTNMVKIPVSTAEVALIFPLGTMGGFIWVVSQLQRLIRLRRAISEQIKKENRQMDVTLIAPLLIEQKQNILEKISGLSLLFFPLMIFLFSVNLILVRFDLLVSKLPYFQKPSFYLFLYFLSVSLLIYKLWELSLCLKLNIRLLIDKLFNSDDQL